jgi:glycosyltransferase involved in cell wall biosynthesis
MGIRIMELEISEPFHLRLIADGVAGSRLLVRSKGRPLGWLLFKEGEIISEDLVKAAIQEQLRIQLRDQYLKEAFLESSEAMAEQAISVVICTRDRPGNLATCLEHLKKLDYSNYEVIVVDNAPSDDRTYTVAGQFQVRYVREEVAGLDRARNTGLANASYNIIAFTDDDVRVDKYWLKAINNCSSQQDLACVSGYVAPAVLNTAYQEIFEFGYGGMGHGFSTKYFRRQLMKPQKLVWASGFGIGANMAFRKSVFQEIGNFEEALDVGTPTHGGGDIEMFHRLVARGFVMQYEPAMLVWHHHRETKKELARQIYDNGRGFGAYLLHRYRQGTISKYELVRFLFINWLVQWNMKNLLGFRPPFPRWYSWQELKGMLSSPFAYRRSISLKMQLKGKS